MQGQEPACNGGLLPFLVGLLRPVLFRSRRIGAWSCDQASRSFLSGFDRKTQFCQDRDRSALASFKVTRTETLTCSEFIGGAENRLVWVAVAIPHQFVGPAGAETVF
jgi:hypothetical protein